MLRAGIRRGWRLRRATRDVRYSWPFVIVALTLVWACADRPSTDGEAIPAGGEERPMPPEARVVDVARPETLRTEVAAPPADSYRTTLYVERDVRVTARRSGVIESILVDRGQRVRQGQELALLESDIARDELRVAEEDLRLASAEYDRVRSLFGQGIVSEQDNLRAEIARNVSEARAALSRDMLERCTVRAPFDGTVVERWAVVGERLVEDDSVPLFRIVANDPLRARVDVPEERLPDLGRGQTATIEAAATGESVRGRVVHMSGAVDPASGTVAVIVEADGRTGAIRPGAAVTVRFGTAGETGSPSLKIPRIAISPAGGLEGEPGTLLVAQDGRARTRRIEVLRIEGPLALVRGDLTATDQVIVGDPGEVSEGEPVIARSAVR